MDSIVDIIRMEVLTNASKREKDKWKYLILLAILSHYRQFFHQLKKYIVEIFMKLGMLRKCIKPVSRVEKQPKSLVRLKFSKNETNNKIFKELLNRHAIEFDVAQLRDANLWHIIHPKTISLATDIYFRLDFAEKPQSECEDGDNAQAEKVVAKGEATTRAAPAKDLLNLTHDFDLLDSRGQVFSYNLPLHELLDFLHDNYVPKEPKPPIQTVIPKKVSLFNMQVGRATRFDDKSDELLGEWLEFPVSKNLENIFLEPELRERLLSQIDRFNDPVWYAERGLPRTLGILLHGKPGCGKTSFIKAICAYMRRKVVIVDFKLVNTVAHLRKIFSGYMKEDKPDEQAAVTYRFARESTVYVFEDFDCMSNIFMDRKLKEKEESQDNKENVAENEPKSLLQEMLMLKQMETMHKIQRDKRKKKKKQHEKKKGRETEKTKTDKPATESNSSDSDMEADINLLDEDNHIGFGGGIGKNFYADYGRGKWGSTLRMKERVTLADFLELLDGIVEMDGRIIIMTTNQREKMDSALVRPGRIDLDLELHPPSRLLIGHIFKHMYKHVDEHILRQLFIKYYDYLSDQLVPTARVMNCFMFLNPESGLRALLESGYQLLEAQRAESGKSDKEQRQVMPFDITETQEERVWTAESVWAHVLASAGSTMSTGSPVTTAAIASEKVVDLYEFFRDKPHKVQFHSSPVIFPVDINILNVAQNEVYYSTGGPHPQPFVIFDFTKYTVNPTEYTIVNRPPSLCRLYNWNLEASHDKMGWVILSKHRRDPSLIKMCKNEATFALPPRNEHFRYIRFITVPWSYYNDGGDKQLMKESCAFDLCAIQIKGYIKSLN